MVMFLIPSVCFSDDLGSYLILHDIGGYKFRPKPTKRVYGNSGILIPVGHFDLDHDDITYETRYILPERLLGMEVKVTQHTGSDSGRWLLHEVDAEFRDYYGIPDLSFTVRNIEGQTVLVFSSGGRDYRWVSGNKVIMIEYTALEMSKKPEPIEIVKAYLAKHPSTIPSISLSELRSPANKTLWIKNEMERRLWLCEKWFLQLQMGKVDLEETLDSVVKSMAVFLNYREKYYGIKAADEGVALLTSLNQKDGTSIRNKLATYKTWWAVNKTRSISLP